MLPNDSLLPEAVPSEPASPAPVAEPVSIIRPRAKAPAANGQGNGHPNGHSNGDQANGNGHYPQRRLTLQMPALPDYDESVRLMQLVRGLLEQSLAGEQGDQVFIQLPSHAGLVTLKQREHVTCSGALLDGLREVLGSEGVFVEG